MVVCCLCAKTIVPNAVTMCPDCIRAETTITRDIPNECDLFQCPVCEKFNIIREKWIRHDFESNGLMSLCLKKIPALERAKILDARWIWTEPHSKRLKVCVDIEKESLEKVTIRQRVTVTFILKSKQCKECVHEQTAHNWGALVQIRQKGMQSRNSIVSLEQMLIS